MKHLASKALVFASAALIASASMAQASPDTTGYLTFRYGSPDANVWRSGVYGVTKEKKIIGNLCWRTAEWTPAHANAVCDPDFAPKAPEPAPAVKPVPAPVPAVVAPVPAPTPVVQKISLDSKVLFQFAKADLRPEGKAALDREILQKLPQMSKVELVLITGHTDRIGSNAANQKLSERRAETVRAYLVKNGLAADKIESLGVGETQPVTGDSCNQKNRKALINCLAPDRRVEVEIKGDSKSM